MTICGFAFGQQAASLSLPNIIPPTPEAAKLGQFGIFHGNNAAGVPDINVSLYEINTPRFKIPISLSYDASGIKVDEMPTWVGQGWSLNAGGVITRTIVGAADDIPGGYLNTGIKNQNDLAANFHADSGYMENVIHGLQNTQPDYFFYNFNSRGGKFVFGNNQQAILIPTTPLKISVQPSLAAIQVIDEKGDIYNFASLEFTTTSNNGGGSSIQDSHYNITSWYLTQMISADKSDTVSFSYQKDPIQATELSYSFSQQFGTTSDGCTISTTRTVNTNSVVTSYRQYNPLHLTSITYRGGMVKFISKPDRQDLGTASLDSIIAYNYDYNAKTYNRLKAMKLNTGYFYSSVTNPINATLTNLQYRLRLDSVVESDNNNIRVDAYTFDYNALSPPPINNFAQDTWGYYNGQTSNSTLLKLQNIYDASYGVYSVGGANRSVNGTYMQAGILTGIHYPTKGSTQFTYEPNLYPGTITNTVNYSVAATGGGGLGTQEENSSTFTTPALLSYASVTASISAFNNLMPPVPSPPYVKITNVATGQIVYETGGNPNANVYMTTGLTLQPNTQYQLYAEAKTNPSVSAIISLAFYTTKSQTVAGGGLRIEAIKNYDLNGNLLTHEIYKYGANETGIGTLISTPFALTDNITNVINSVGSDCESGGPAGNDATCHQTFDHNVLYNSNSMYELSSLDNSPIAYTSITRYDGDTTQNIGKSIYQYDLYPDQQWPGAADNNYGVLLLSFPYLNGQLNHESHYRNVNGVYSLVKDKITSYQSINGAIDTGLVVNYTYNYSGCYQLTPSCYSYYNYPINSGVKLPQQTTETDYDATGQNVLVQKLTNYFYDNLAHLQPTRMTTVSSQGDNLQQTFVYPQDMVNNGADPTAIYALMSTANMLNPVIEAITFKNGAQLTQTKTNYNTFNGIIKPNTVEFQKATSPSEIRLNFQSYDLSGNLLTVSQQTGPSIAYQWGYNKSYPVAKVSNAKSNDIFYDSFEEGDGTSTRGDAKTGHYSYIGAYQHNLTGLDANTYTLSYWSESSGGIWTLVVNNVSVSGSTYLINLPAGQVDDVCFYPQGALITTYTYDPMIGITGTTEPSGKTTLYEYDSFQRLLNIKDQYGNIIKSFCYNYAGQAFGCNINVTGSSSGSTSGSQTTPYVQMTLSSTSNATDVNGNGQVSKIYTIGAFSDVACTIPYTLPIGLTVNYQVNTSTTYTSQGQTGAPIATSTSLILTMPAGTSQRSTNSIMVNGCTGTSQKGNCSTSTVVLVAGTGYLLGNGSN